MADAPAAPANAPARPRARAAIERLPPHNLDAEVAVLGSVLLDNECCAEVAARVEPDDFYHEAHRYIFRAMLALFDHRQPIDYVSVLAELERAGVAEAAGGIPFLTDLVNRVPSAANALYYAKLVRKNAMLRQLIGVTNDLNQQAYEFAGDLDDFLEQAEQQVFALTQRGIGQKVHRIRDVLRETFQKLEEYQERGGSLTGLPSGFIDLDFLTGGFQNGEMIVLAARPSMGKTTLALTMIQYLGLNEGVPLAFFSCEMGRMQITMNMLVSDARINSHRLRQGYLNELEYDRLIQSAGRLADAQIFIDDTPAITLRELRAKARRLVERQQVKAVIVDYLQLMTPPPPPHGGRSSNREQDVARLSAGLKAMARELDVPVIVLAQLNRGVEGRTGDKRPRLSDLRESGAIEQDADVVMLLHREYYYSRKEEDKGLALLLLAKQRNGPTGDANLIFRQEYMRFENATGSDADGDGDGYSANDDGGTGGRGGHAGGSGRGGRGSGATPRFDTSPDGGAPASSAAVPAGKRALGTGTLADAANAANAAESADDRPSRTLKPHVLPIRPPAIEAPAEDASVSFVDGLAATPSGLPAQGTPPPPAEPDNDAPPWEDDAFGYSGEDIPPI